MQPAAEASHKAWREHMNALVKQPSLQQRGWYSRAAPHSLAVGRDWHTGLSDDPTDTMIALEGCMVFLASRINATYRGKGSTRREI